MFSGKAFSSLRTKFILIFISLGVGTVIANTMYTTYLYKNFAVKREMAQASEDVLLISSKIETMLGWVLRDLFFLRDLPMLQKYINLRNCNEREKAGMLSSIEKTFLALAERHRIYLQVRFINSGGMEIIRINFDGETATCVPESELQYKGERYYFKDAIRFKKGEIYVSPMDLNIEHGKIERPFVPTIRYATTVTDKIGQTKGIIIVNVLGKAILGILEKHQDETARLEKNYYLVDSNGYFLFHPDPTKTFGFMFDNKETLYLQDQCLMSLMLGKDHGTLFKNYGTDGQKTLISYRRIPLLSEIPNITRSSNNSSSGRHIISETKSTKPFWILFSTLKESRISPSLGRFPKSFFLVTALLVLGCVVVSVAVAYFITRPIISLADAARKIQAGDLSARASVYSSDEMGEFGNVFNAMASQLEKNINKLKASESKFRHLFEKSKDCFFVMDVTGKILNMNESCANLIGIQFLEKEPGNIVVPFHGNRTEKIGKLNHKLAHEGYVRDYEVHLKRNDGKLLVCLMTATASYDENGMLVGCEGIFRDITERRKRIRARQYFQKRLREEVVMAEERERRNIGLILHEDVAQNLALVNMKIESAEMYFECGGEGETNYLKESRELLAKVIDQIRTMTFELYPPMLDREGLIPTIEWYARNFTEKTHIPVTIYALGTEVPLTRSQEVYLFRAYRELLHNVWKHAGAGEIVVTVVGRDGVLRLVVDDDGKGFDVESALKFSKHIKGIGLFSVQEWVSSMNGNFSIESSHQKGTRVIIEIPVSDTKEEEI